MTVQQKAVTATRKTRRKVMHKAAKVTRKTWRRVAMIVLHGAVRVI